MDLSRYASDPEGFWEDFYTDREEIWSGNANPLLVREVESLAPGTALELGCGEGADAVWLAQRGWRVTGVDISATALRRAAERASRAGVSVTWDRHDLSATFPDGTFDLVSAQFLQSPVAGPGEWQTILRNAAGAVAPGGTLVFVCHAAWPSWMETPPHDFRFPTMAEIMDTLALSDRWRIEVTEVVMREHPGPDGQPGKRGDNVVRVKRLS